MVAGARGHRLLSRRHRAGRLVFAGVDRPRLLALFEGDGDEA
jgi:hypothetical protein